MDGINSLLLVYIILMLAGLTAVVLVYMDRRDRKEGSKKKGK